MTRINLNQVLEDMTGFPLRMQWGFDTSKDRDKPEALYIDMTLGKAIMSALRMENDPKAKSDPNMKERLDKYFLIKRISNAIKKSQEEISLSAQEITMIQRVFREAYPTDDYFPFYVSELLEGKIDTDEVEENEEKKLKKVK